MSKTAGFGMLLQFRQEAAQLAINVAHASGQLPTWRSDTIDLFGDDAEVAFTLFSDAPKITFEAARPTQVTVDQRLSGRVVVTGVGDGLDRNVVFRIRVRVGVFADTTDGVAVRLQADQAELLSLTVEPFADAPAIPNWFRGNVEMEANRERLMPFIVQGLASVPAITPPFEIPVLGAFTASSTVGGATVRVLDKGIAIGLDLGEPAYAGNPAAITDQLGTSSLSVLLHPNLIGRLAGQLTAELAGKQMPSQVTVYGEGDHITVAGTVTWEGASFTIVVRLRARLGDEQKIVTYDDEDGGSFTEVHDIEHDGIWMEFDGADHDVDLPWWATFAAVGMPVVFLIIDYIVGRVMTLVNTSAPKVLGLAQLPGLYQQTLPGTAGPPVTFRLSMAKTDVDGVRLRTRMSVEGNELGKVSGPAYYDSEATLKQPPVYAFTGGEHLHHPEDPNLWMEWQVRRQDTGALITTQRAPSTVAHPFRTLDLSDQILPNPDISEFILTATLQRRVGGDIEALAKDSMNVHIQNRLATKHRFVRWEHTAYCPVYVDGSSENKVVKEYYSSHRRSRVHFTSPTKRCRFADSFPEDVDPWLFDQLPFTQVDADGHRDQLCDYCFYGGPDKTEMVSISHEAFKPVTPA
jgi:hypothetical protein